MSSHSVPVTSQPLKVLSLDGGGVRGLSSLLILEKIAEHIRDTEGYTEIQKPCEMFDLIGGTGTGGIIAIMLGRLKMTLHQSIQAYKSLAETVLRPERTKLFTTSPGARLAQVETAIKRMIRENCSETQCVEQRLRGSPTADSCPHEDTLFRDKHSTKTIGRDKEQFIDAKYGYNNPCEVLIGEAEKAFPGRKMMILSIGTGLGDVVEISDSKDSVFRAYSKVATTSKQVDLRLREKHSSTGGYYRLNVENGLEDVAPPDSQDPSNIAGHTRNYLGENKNLVADFARAFVSGTLQSSQKEYLSIVYLDDDDKKCLSDLFVTDPSIDKRDIEEKKGGLLKDCYEWILEHPNFKRFKTDSESRVLWIKEDPGKGKTMLLCGIIDELQSDLSLSLSYFFCQAAGRYQLNTATSVLRGLIHHLASHNPQLMKYLRAEYDSKGKEIFDNHNTWKALCDVMTSMLNDSTVKNAILIVDALDECSVERDRLLKFISTTLPAKWIVSSRNWLDIEEVLNDAEQKVNIHLEINQSSISTAVESYIKFKADQLVQKKKYNDQMKATVLEHLRSNADGTFLWVALVCKELSNPTTRKWETIKKLKSFPPGLDSLYGRMLEQIDGSDNADLFKAILATVLSVYRPVTLEELRALVEDLMEVEQADVEEVVSLCGSFLAIHGNIVSFVHQSAKDYLLTERSSKILSFSMPHRHHIIFMRSLDVLYTTLSRDIYGLLAPGSLISEVTTTPNPDPLAPIRYSCIFWVDHLHESLAVFSGNDKLLEFFTERYLQWLEALSLLRNISAGAKALRTLEVDLKGKGTKRLQDIVKDAHRFLLFSVGIIEMAPLQVYASALIFSPTNSLIRQQFRHEEPNWIEVKPKVETDWNVCVQTLDGHDDAVVSVVFSDDDQRLASRSDGETVKIWDATSGTCLHTLENHDGLVTPVVFSNDGQRLASGSWDNTVKIWDTTSGTCLHTLEGHTSWVTSVVFSNDSQRLASGSNDKTVKIWDVTSGSCLHTLIGHSGRVTSLVFSNDGQRLASGSDDKTVKIWDAISGTCLHTLEGCDHRVTSVVFSNNGQQLALVLDDMTVKIWDDISGTYMYTLEGPNGKDKSIAFSNDGQRLASWSWDKTVRIWDVTSGTCLHTLEGHNLDVTSVMFSNDGQRLASGSNDNTVKIWDVTSGTYLHTLEGHDEKVRSAVFSNNGQRLASGSDDMTVKIWDATCGTGPNTFGGHDGVVNWMVFSSDGQRLASGSWDKTVKIWDVTSGTCLHTLGRHKDQVEPAIFSNDGQRLALETWDGIVEIWDATSGTCLHTLEDQYYRMTSVMFSNDGQRLASGSDHKTVKIWDVTSGTCLHTLEGHTSWVTSVVFSNDGQRLASGSGDMTVKIWDATSGTCLHTLEGHTSWVTSVVFSNDGQRLASGSGDMTVKIWDATSGTCLHTLDGHDDAVVSVVFSDDDQRLASRSDGETVKIWDATSGTCLHNLEGHGDMVTSVVLSSDGQRLASRPDDKTVKIWDATSGTCLHTLEGHTSWVTSVVFSNDGQRLASGSDDKTVKIWDATSGTCLHNLEGHTSWVTSVVFSNDGQRLASGSGDMTVKIWDATSGLCQNTHSLGQNITFSLNPFGHFDYSLDVGLLDLDLFTASHIPPTNQAFSLDPNLANHGFIVDSPWIMKDGKRMLWLPPSYRPSVFEVDEDIVVHRNRVAICSSSRRIFFLGFRSIG
ncbi:Vegetative incompatibility protein HET-E-1 [Ceratocystis lukuohia]|uniref:Vegetative incompatibility protein HET-E-1 n=1 Tax=Ceratocystis lukuohia TaxID=2019550 RepID=A0ABR4MC78_9PEZI